MNTTYFPSSSNEFQSEAGGLTIKDLSSDYRLKDFEESLIPGAIDYTNYWNSFVD